MQRIINFILRHKTSLLYLFLLFIALLLTIQNSAFHRSRFVRSSPRKARLVADLIRGKRVDDAMNLLTFSDKRAAQMLRKTLQTAIADAEQAEADTTRLFVTESRVDAGATMKRFQPKDRGRAHQILKRTSHLTIGVEEMA